MSTTPTGPWQVTGDVPKAIYTIPVSSPSYNVTYVTVQESNNDAVVFATAMAFTGMMVAWGCVVWGIGLLLSAVPRVLRRLPVLLPALSELRLRRVVQPVDRRVHARRVGVRPVRRRRRGAALQPDDRHLLARRGGVRPVRRARRGAGLQPAHRHVRPDAAGLERVRQLGQHAGAARRSVGQHAARPRTTSPATTTRATQSSGGGTAVSRTRPAPAATPRVAKTGSGDVYAGHDGNVYKKSGDSWQKYGGDGNWNSVQQPTPTQKQQRAARRRARRRRRGRRGWDSATAVRCSATRPRARRASSARATTAAAAPAAREPAATAEAAARAAVAAAAAVAADHHHRAQRRQAVLSPEPTGVRDAGGDLVIPRVILRRRCSSTSAR